MLVILKPMVCSCLCSCLLVSFMRTKMMVWPSFSQLGKTMSFSTDTLSIGLGHLRAQERCASVYMEVAHALLSGCNISGNMGNCALTSEAALQSRQRHL